MCVYMYMASEGQAPATRLASRPERKLRPRHYFKGDQGDM